MEQLELITANIPKTKPNLGRLYIFSINSDHFEDDHKWNHW